LQNLLYLLANNMASSSRNQTKFTSKLHGKKVLILGGTSGIGFAVAEGALEFGAHVIVSSSTSDKVENAQKRLKEAYPDYADRVSGKTCDLSNPETLEANLRALLDFAGKSINHIIHTAGDRLKITPVRDVTAEILQTTSIVRFTSCRQACSGVPRRWTGVVHHPYWGRQFYPPGSQLDYKCRIRLR